MTTEMLFATAPQGTHREIEAASPLTRCLHTIDLPLVPVLLRMEQAGVRIDSTVSSARCPAASRSRSTTSPSASTLETMGIGPHRFNINSPKQLGDVLFNKMLSPSR
jgi:DNA polymerase-1